MMITRGMFAFVGLPSLLPGTGYDARVEAETIVIDRKTPAPVVPLLEILGDVGLFLGR